LITSIPWDRISAALEAISKVNEGLTRATRDANFTVWGVT